MDASFDNRTTWHCFYPALVKEGKKGFLNEVMRWACLGPIVENNCLVQWDHPSFFFQWENCSFHCDRTPWPDNMQSSNILPYTCCPHPFSSQSLCAPSIFVSLVNVTFLNDLPVTEIEHVVCQGSGASSKTRLSPGSSNASLCSLGHCSLSQSSSPSILRF